MVFYIYIPIGVYFFIQLVLFDDVIRHVRDFESHLFGSFHWRVQIEISDGNGREFGSFGRYGAVEYKFTVIWGFWSHAVSKEID